jgi:signal transduction histidine kinase
VGIVGHDLRTPLAAIHMGVQLLQRRGDLGEDQRRTIGRVGASASRMALIIRDLLDFTRVRREGRIPVERRPGDLAEVARRTIAELATAYPARVVSLDAPGPAPVLGDPERLAQVISNLAVNAVQHSSADSRVRIRVGAAPGQAVLEVHNDGPPIDPDLLPAVFEPFRRGSRHTGAWGSIGLGLHIVREVVRAHGGTVEARSSREEGTTFTVRIPSTDSAPMTTGGDPPPW